MIKDQMHVGEILESYTLLKHPSPLLLSHATLKLSATVSEFKTKLNFYALISHLSFSYRFLTIQNESLLERV